VGVDGIGLRQLTTLPNDFADHEWSPDGTRIACTVSRGGVFELCLIDTASGAAAQMPGCYDHPSWSPDAPSFELEALTTDISTP
jgi:Tol biopolymer transport system component